MTFDTSVIELSRSALKNNYRFFRRLTGKRTRISCVVKANAYGHGIPTFVPLAEECGANHFSVFSASEAVKVLQSARQDSDVMIMGAIRNEELPWAIENGVSFYVFELDRLNAATKHARRMDTKARIHLELETGMNRIGFQEPELTKAIEMVKENLDHLSIDGVCTHYAGAESCNNYLRVTRQIERFNHLCKRLGEENVPYKSRHSACSAAVFNYPPAIMDMVRIGISMYGFFPTQETKTNYMISVGKTGPSKKVNPLKRVMRWRSRVMAVKEVEEGEFIGYGTTCLATRRRKVASVPVGYYHGFARNLSNLGYALIHGHRAKVAGLVNMNMMLVDVTEIREGVKKDDEVVLIGRQKHGHISVSSFSDMTRNPTWEVLTRLPAEIPRLIVD
ncbi:alanine racemase [Candidatus Fermentibacteria bacterium]|nr:alanine racemase [Candidatus Fermentibacteria bacterium]